MFKAKISGNGMMAKVMKEIRSEAKTVKLTYALKLIFNPDFCNFWSKSSKRGRICSVFSPIS
jgi:hypothetical protein